MKRYFEFNDHGYYALVVTPDRPEGTSMHQFMSDAMGIYVENVAFDALEESFKLPSRLSEDEAFSKFISAQTESEEIGDLIFEFESSKDCVLLIDGSLI